MADPCSVSITLSGTDWATLRSWTSRRSTAHDLAARARIALACAVQGTTDLAIAARLSLESLPRGAIHWSTGLLAREPGISKTAIPHIWRAFALAPYQCETFKLLVLSPFIDKFWDIVGMYAGLF